MSERRRNWSAKSTSSLEEIPEPHLAKLRRQLQEREKKKKEGEVPRHDVHREPPLSPSSRARAEEERIHKLYPILPGCLVEKYGISSYVQREAELSAASRPAVAPTPDVVWIPLQATTTDEVPCPVPLSSQNISCPVVTRSNQLSLKPSTSKESSTASTSTFQSFNTPLDQSREQAGTSNHFNESAERRNEFQKMTDFQSEEQRVKDRIALIDRTMEDLHSERKALTDKVLSLKQEQYELLLSTTPDHPFGRVSASRFSEATTTISKTPAATESAQPIEESSPAQPIPPAASTELLSLMHQLEENGVHRDMEVPSDPVATVSVGTKRRRIPSGESESKKMKRTTTSSPSRNGVDIPPVEKLEQVPTNGAVVQSMQPIGTLAVPQTLSISQSDQISLTISSVMSQSVESSCPKKTPTPAIFSNESKNAASPSELTEESQDQTKEISTGKAQTGYSSTKVVEPTVPQPKVAELKVAEQVVKSKVVQPKVVQTKKSSTAAKASKTTQKPTDANSRSLENCRTSSRREESSTQKATSKPSKVNAQPSEADSKLPAPATESNPAKDTAAATASTSASETVSADPVLLPPHLTAVKCVYVHGPCACTASEDGTVHIYDLDKNSLVKRMSAHLDPVTCLYVLSLRTSSGALSTIKSTTEYLSHLTLVTGSEDAHIRQFDLDSGVLIDDQIWDYAPTCVAGTKTLKNQYFGTKDGVVLYDPKNKSIRRLNKFTVNGEVICMKIIWIRGKKAIIVAARRMDPIVFDLETEDSLFTLDSSKNSVYCLSSSLKYVFCCDDDKKVIICDAKTGLVNHSQTLSSAALSAFLYRKRFLVLCCMDGVIRGLDTRHRPPYHIFTLPGQGLKTLTCMEVVGETIVGGTLNGEVLYCRLPNLEALSKASL